MNNQLITQRKIDGLNTSKSEKMTHLKYLGRLLFASFVLTFLLYLAFSLSLYVGDIFNLQTIIDSFLGGAFGLAFFAVISILLAFVLSGTKHAAYIHFSMFKTVKIILVLMVFTGILSEVFNSSGVQDSKARTINSNNTEYNSLVSSDSASSIKMDSGLTDRIAYAEKILARCKTKLAAGKEKHCNGDQAKLTALLASQKTLMDAQLSASSANQSDKFKRLDEIKAESYNPAIRSLSKMFNISMSSAISFLMLIFAALFEAMHYYLSVMRRDTLRAIEDIQNALDRAEVDYLNESEIKERKTENSVPESTLSDFPEENRTRWNSQNNVTATRQDFVGFVNPNTVTATRVTNAKPNTRAYAYRTHDTRSTDTRNNGSVDTRSTSKPDTRSENDSGSTYDKLKKLIISKNLSVTYRPIKAWMKSENIETSDKKRQDLTMQYLDKMFAEGILKLNPANNGTGINKAKYVLA